MQTQSHIASPSDFGSQAVSLFPGRAEPAGAQLARELASARGRSKLGNFQQARRGRVLPTKAKQLGSILS